MQPGGSLSKAKRRSAEPRAGTIAANSAMLANVRVMVCARQRQAPRTALLHPEARAYTPRWASGQVQVRVVVQFVGQAASLSGQAGSLSYELYHHPSKRVLCKRLIVR